MNPRLSQLEAERIIQTLGDGVPVPDHIRDYSSEVSSSLLESVQEQLDKARRGLTVAKFVKGDYGAGKSHLLYLVRAIALEEDFVVSYFDLRAREGFDMIERILSKLIMNISVFEKRKGDIEETVLDFIIRKWATEVQDTDEDIKRMRLDITNRDFVNAMMLYGRIMSNNSPRFSSGVDLVEMLNRWFQAEGLLAGERRAINIRNNITARNARDTLNMLSIFFRAIGYSGWVILIDEQEIIPILMSKRKRNLSNENLKVIIDTQPKTEGFYYLFATTPEFFTDPVNGINAYPALRQRVFDVMEVQPISEKEMTEAARKIRNIFHVAHRGFDQNTVTEETLRFCAKYVEQTYANISAKARIFVLSYVRLLNMLKEGLSSEPRDEFQAITARIWDELEQKTREAYSHFE